MCCKTKWFAGFAALLLAVAGGSALIRTADAQTKTPPVHDDTTLPKELEWALPDETLKMPFKDEQPISFVTRTGNPKAWAELKGFWNETTEKSFDPKTGAEVTRKAVVVKVPLGQSAVPSVPAENPMTVQKWALGKKLYYDHILSSDLTVSCASCHDPAKGFTDQLPNSLGIGGKRGGMSAPSVINSAYNALQFWDGRAASLEEQSQGPPQNNVEMFDGKGNAWRKVVERIRAKAEYGEPFKKVFGALPTRDSIAKAIATYERTVLSGNSIHDRAELNQRERVAKDDTGREKNELLAKDYRAALDAAFAAKDAPALRALKLDPAADAGKTADVAKRLANGRNLFFNKARCNACHVGDNFTDNGFHNLGVGVKDGKLPVDLAGRFGAQPTGAKNSDLYGAFKTPMLRALLDTAPYMHDGGEKTLEAVIDFYDKGGNANEFLDIRMRDEDAERAYLRAKAEGKEYTGPKVHVFNGKPIVPLALKLTAEEKADLVLFMRALQGDPLDPVVADPEKFPK